MGALLAIVWAKVRAQDKRIDELRDDVKELRPEHKADNRALAGKLDRLVESLLMAMDTDLPSSTGLLRMPPKSAHGTKWAKALGNLGGTPLA